MSSPNAIMMQDTNAAACAFVVVHARSLASAPVLVTDQGQPGAGGCRGTAGGPSFQR